MKRFNLISLGAAFMATLFASAANAQTHPKLHVNTRWKSCSIQLDPSLTQAAWHKFTAEAGQLVSFRPLADAQPMGRGSFELALMQWQTNVDDNSSAWNDTFVHPDSMHWLYEGSGLQFPGLAARLGVTSSTDVGAYFTKNVQANYGAYGFQLQQSVVQGSDWNVAARASYMALFGPEDVDLSVAGAEVVTSWKGWKYGAAKLVPYGAVSTYLSRSHEKSPVVNLADEHVVSAMATIGAALEVKAVRLGAETSISRLPSFALKVGFAR